MRIQSMRATFGKLVDQELKLRPGLNVISGGNEAGKSTWLAFLMTMLYGLDTRERVRAGRLPDKVKYLPWSGQSMAGTMVVTDKDDRSITLERTSQTAPMGDFRAWDTQSGFPAPELTGKTCGQTLLGVEAAVYARSGFLGQQRASVSPDAQLEKRLSGLVTAGDENYAYADVDERLKKLQSAIRHNQSGVLPRAEQRMRELDGQLADIAQRQHELGSLKAEVAELKRQRGETQQLLEGLAARDRQDQRRRLAAGEEALAAAKEDREGWEQVCADLPREEALQDIQTELDQLQKEIENVALAQGLTAEELVLPPPDPVFGRMNARDAHDKAANDATLVKEAAKAKRPRKKRSSLWIVLSVLGLLVTVGCLIFKQNTLAISGVLVLLAGLSQGLSLRLQNHRAKKEYMELQAKAREILTQYGARDAKEVVLRGISYIESLGGEEEADDNKLILQELADRRQEILARLDALMPGSGTPEKAAALFQEAASARQALAQAKLLESERSEQLRELRLAIGILPPEEEDAPAEGDVDRQAEEERLRELDRQIESVNSRADKLAGAISQMGDALALNAEKEALAGQIARLQDRLASLQLARKALEVADGALRARFAPLLTQRTGELFRKLTGGKYDKIQLDRSFHVTVHPVNSPVFRPLSYLSGGTVDQLYLALRLAICDLILPEAPIVLDDALVYFDDKRATLALETLREMSKTRQILLFTCQSREKRILDELAAKRKAQEAEAAQEAAPTEREEE